MTAYSIRIESTSPSTTLEIVSAATWARAPGRLLAYEAPVEPVRSAYLSVDDRTLVFGHASEVRGPLTVVLQIATVQDRVTLRAALSPDARMRLTSVADSRVNEPSSAGATSTDVVLYLDPTAAALAGAHGGDQSLA